MNSDDFEARLRRQAVRQVPAEWREEIVTAAQRASQPAYGTRNMGHAQAPASFLSLVSTLFWPSPRAWGALAAVWVLLLGLNFMSGDAAETGGKRSRGSSSQTLLALREQQRVLTELLGPREPQPAEPPKVVSPRPRSERPLENAAV